MSNGGFIVLYRKFLEWEWYDDMNTKALFLHCMLRANHRDKNWRGTTVKRGQFISSRGKLAQELGLSEQQIRTSLKKLNSTNEITSVGKSQHTVFTVENYEKYQSSNQQPNQQATNEQPTSNQQVTTNNNENNENNENNDKPKAQRPKKKPQKRSYPEDFEITQSMRDWFAGKSFTFDIDEKTEEWANSMRSKADEYQYTDWVSAWRNAMTKRQEWLNQEKPKTSPRKEL